MKQLLLLLAFLTQIPSSSYGVEAKSCEIAIQDLTSLSSVSENLKPGWTLPAPRSPEYAQYAASLPLPMRRELENVGRWSPLQTALPRIAVPVARMTEQEITNIAMPRNHQPLPSINAAGELFYPDFVKIGADGKPQASETFHVRMMAVKNKHSLEMILPKEVEYLRPFFEKAWQLEINRDPVGFKDRFAFIQVDSSWVEASQNQPRPGKTTTQSADISYRQGGHVDGFLQRDFWDMTEDITYATSFGYNPDSTDHEGDNIPTEYFNLGFPIPPGLTHPQARLIYDQIANQNPSQVVTFPAGVISRMSSRSVHRVGIARAKTYRTFVKIKFTDELFNQIENSINLTPAGVPIAMYAQWNKAGVPLVDRKTIPTEGLIEPQDAHFFNSSKKALRDFLP